MIKVTSWIKEILTNTMKVLQNVEKESDVISFLIEIFQDKCKEFEWQPLQLFSIEDRETEQIECDDLIMSALEETRNYMLWIAWWEVKTITLSDTIMTMFQYALK